MTFIDFMRRNKPIRDLGDAICERFGVPGDRMEQFAAIMYESGQFDMRIDTLVKWLDTHPEPDNGETEVSEPATEGS